MNILDAQLVKAARQEEIRGAEAMEVWVKVPRIEAVAKTGKAPVGTILVDTDKGDGTSPNVRSRVVAQELRRESDFILFVATPPIEYVKYLVSRTASNQGRGSSSSCLMVQCI